MRTPMFVRAATAVTVLAAPIGCGGDDSLSAEDFRSEANEICRAGNERLEQILDDVASGLESGESPSAERIEEVFGRALEDIRGQLSDLRALDGPGDLEAEVDDVLDEAGEAVDALDRQIADDPLALLEQEEDPFAEVNSRFVDLELTECGGT